MLDILFEDNQVIVVIKPHNIPSQSDESNDKDMLTIVKEYIKEKYQKPGNVYVGLVHRLDRPTGGIMVFAKTSKAAARLSEQIKDGSFEKTYYAVLSATPKDKIGHLVHFLLKDEKTNVVSIVPQGQSGAKRAELVYEIKGRHENLAFVKVSLFTGRSHQIRVQMASIDCPIVGDVKYNGIKNGNHLSLWAGGLNFIHPVTKEKMVFKVQPQSEYPWTLFNLDKDI